MGRDADAASLVAIHGKLMQLVRQIQSERLANIKVSAHTRPDHVAGVSRRSGGFGLLNQAAALDWGFCPLCRRRWR